MNEVTTPDKPVNAAEPEFSKEDIQREELGRRGCHARKALRR